MEQLTVREYAQLKGCTERWVRNMVQEGRLKTEISFGTGGTSGKSYLIPLASIEPKLQKKYMRLHKEKFPELEKNQPALVKSLEELTCEERQEVNFWLAVLNQWQYFREHTENKKIGDEKFVNYLQEKYPGKKFSPRMLLRQWKALQEQGEAALIDRRGKHENHKKAIPDPVFDIFQFYYLDESRKSVKKCIELTELAIREEMPELLPLATSATFARKIEKEIPAAVLQYFRYGEKAFKDKCAPYIERMYEDLNSNDIWVCDNHTFDVFVNDEKHQKPVRVYLTGFLDVRSRKMVGWYVTLNPCSDATLFALRRGIEHYGIPKRILSDNGREFLTFDIGGRGFRKTAKTQDHIAPTILDGRSYV